MGKKQRLVIVNLQKTPLDYLASLRINGKCDDVMKLLMSKLSLEIPEFRLTRYDGPVQSQAKSVHSVVCCLFQTSFDESK